MTLACVAAEGTSDEATWCVAERPERLACYGKAYVRARSSTARGTTDIHKFPEALILLLVRLQLCGTKIFDRPLATIRGGSAGQPSDIALEVIRETELAAERGPPAPATDARTASNRNVQRMGRQTQRAEGAVAGQVQRTNAVAVEQPSQLVPKSMSDTASGARATQR